MRQHRLSDDWLRSQNWPTQTHLGRRATSTSTSLTLSLLSQQAASVGVSAVERCALHPEYVDSDKQQRFTYSKTYIFKHSSYRFLGLVHLGKTKITPLGHLLGIFLHYLNAGSDLPTSHRPKWGFLGREGTSNSPYSAPAMLHSSSTASKTPELVSQISNGSFS